MCFSLFFSFTPTAECHLLPMVPCHVQAEGGTGPAGCSCGVLSRRKGRAPGQSRPGGVCCPSLLAGVSAAPRCWGKCLLTLSGVGSATCSMPRNQPPAPGCMFLSSGRGPTLRCTFPSPMSSSTSVSGPCPVRGVWPVGLPHVSSWGRSQFFGPPLGSSRGF